MHTVTLRQLLHHDVSLGLNTALKLACQRPAQQAQRPPAAAAHDCFAAYPAARAFALAMEDQSLLLHVSRWPQLQPGQVQQQTLQHVQQTGSSVGLALRGVMRSLGGLTQKLAGHLWPALSGTAGSAAAAPWPVHTFLAAMVGAWMRTEAPAEKPPAQAA